MNLEESIKLAVESLGAKLMILLQQKNMIEIYLEF